MSHGIYSLNPDVNNLSQLSVVLMPAMSNRVGGIMPGLGMSIGTDGTLTANVISVFGRNGNVVAAVGDYAAAQITNAVDASQTYNNPPWMASLAWSKITGAPATGVSSVFGRTGSVVATAGDYSASMITNAVDSTQSYTNPAWITSLAWSKITSPPAMVNTINSTGNPNLSGAVTLAAGSNVTLSQTGQTITIASTATGGAGSQTPWTQNINAAGYQLQSAGNIGIGVAVPAFQLDMYTSGTPNVIHLVSDASASNWNYIRSEAYASASSAYGLIVAGYSVGGTSSAPAVTPAGACLLELRGGGYTNALTYNANITMRAESVFTATSAPTYIAFTTGAASAAEAMRITSAGNVGISTTAPRGNLEVVCQTTSVAGGSMRGLINSQYWTGPHSSAFWMIKGRGTAAAPAVVAVSDSLASILAMAVTSDLSIVAGSTITTQVTTVGTGTVGADLIFSTNTSAANATEKMRIKDNGNVGIATNAPACSLDVNGTIRCTGQTVPASGAGLEFVYSSNSGYVFGYDRGASAYKRLELDGNPLVLNANNLPVGIGIGGSAPNPGALTLGFGDPAPSTFSKTQISFGYNNTQQYPHFIHTRHDSGNTSNAIDFYLNDGTAAGVFPTNAVSVLSMLTGQRVGIGTASPVANLHVFSTKGYVDSSLTNNANAHAIIAISGGTEMAINCSSTYGYGFAFQVRNQGSAGYAYPITLNPLGGYVGVGAASPICPFEVRNVAGVYANGPTAGAATGMFVALSSSTSWGWYIGQASNGNVWTQVQRTDGNTTLYNLILQATGGGATGNVGMGVPGNYVPTARLEVAYPNQGAVNFNTQLVLRESSFNQQYGMHHGFHVIAGTWCGTAQALAGSAGTPLLLNPNGGNVGIGLGAVLPGYRLHVAGGGVAVGSGGKPYSAGDLGVSRESAPAAGVVYFGNSGANYIYFDGSNWNFMPALPPGAGSFPAWTSYTPSVSGIGGGSMGTVTWNTVVYSVSGKAMAINVTLTAYMSGVPNFSLSLPGGYSYPNGPAVALNTQGCLVQAWAWIANNLLNCMCEQGNWNGGSVTIHLSAVIPIS